jgi:hypothetical protein
MDVEFGNAGDVDTQGTGWFVGFSDWTQAGPAHLRHMAKDLTSSGLCVKWFNHPGGQPAGDLKPISEGRTLSMLVGMASEFKIQFCQDHQFSVAKTLTHTLRRPGDFVVWGEGIFHRAFGLAPATILTIRWTPSS